MDGEPGYQVLYKGVATFVKTAYIFSEVYRMLAEKDFDTITIEQVKDDE